MEDCYGTASSNVECVEVDCTDRWRAAINMANGFWAA